MVLHVLTKLQSPTTRVLNKRALVSFRSWNRAISSNISNNNSYSYSKMDLPAYVERLRSGAPPKFPADANSLQFAQKLDSQDSLRHLRDEFILPTKASLKKRALDGSIPGKQQNHGRHTNQVQLTKAIECSLISYLIASTYSLTQTQTTKMLIIHYR